MESSAIIRLPAPAEHRQKGRRPARPSLADGAALSVETSDEVLMGELGDGSREALATLFRRYARLVRSIAYRAVRDAAEADDLVQDIFLLVHRDAKAFDPARGSARVWILRIAHRRAISRHRYLHSRHFYDRVDLDELAAELGDPKASHGQAGDSIEEIFGEAGFRRVFEELSMNQRETLRLHFFEGYSLVEIADKLGQSRGNIKHHYFRGLERLRSQLLNDKLPATRTV
jgi:RNA polymerase sigma-70 factor (ECF subfamily)